MASSGRERIIQATLDLVLRQGFAATTVDQILAKAGLTKGAFFYHFATKDDLATAIMERWVELDLAMLDDVRTRAEKLAHDPLQQLLIMVGLVEEMFETYDEAPPGCLITAFLYQEGAFAEPSRQLAVRSFESWRDAIAAKLEAARAHHPPRVDFDASSVADMFTSAVEGGYSMAKTYADPKAMVDQIRNYRTFLELLFAAEERAKPAPKA